jgi:hypothetical protein
MKWEFLLILETDHEKENKKVFANAGSFEFKKKKIYSYFLCYSMGYEMN